MVRKAVIALALLPASAMAQNVNTQCRWIGSLWSCNTNPGISAPAPLDPAAALAAGAALVPNLAEQDMRQREMRLREREMRLREKAVREQDTPRPVTAIPPPASLSDKYGIDAARRDFLGSLLDHCRSGAPLSAVPADRRELTGSFCYAFDQGRIDEITRSK